MDETEKANQWLHRLRENQTTSGVEKNSRRKGGGDISDHIAHKFKPTGWKPDPSIELTYDPDPIEEKPDDEGDDLSLIHI